MTVSRFLWLLTFQMDTLIAARVLDKHAVGSYSVSMTIAMLLRNTLEAARAQAGEPSWT